MSLSKKLRFEVFKRDSFTCQYCGEMAPGVVLEVDHIHPKSKGGEDDILNLITSCFDCNRGKRDNKLSDNAVISKQIDQLKELQERREQLQFLIAWKEGFKDLFEDQFNLIKTEFVDYNIDIKNIHIHKTEFLRLIKKYGFGFFYECFQIVLAIPENFELICEFEGEVDCWNDCETCYSAEKHSNKVLYKMVKHINNMCGYKKRQDEKDQK